MPRDYNKLQREKPKKTEAVTFSFDKSITSELVRSFVVAQSLAAQRAALGAVLQINATKDDEQVRELIELIFAVLATGNASSLHSNLVRVIDQLPVDSDWFLQQQLENFLSTSQLSGFDHVCSLNIIFKCTKKLFLLSEDCVNSCAKFIAQELQQCHDELLGNDSSRLALLNRTRATLGVAASIQTLFGVATLRFSELTLKILHFADSLDVPIIRISCYLYAQLLHSVEDYCSNLVAVCKGSEARFAKLSLTARVGILHAVLERVPTSNLCSESFHEGLLVSVALPFIIDSCTNQRNVHVRLLAFPSLEFALKAVKRHITNSTISYTEQHFESFMQEIVTPVYALCMSSWDDDSDLVCYCVRDSFLALLDSYTSMRALFPRHANACFVEDCCKQLVAVERGKSGRFEALIALASKIGYVKLLAISPSVISVVLNSVRRGVSLRAAMKLFVALLADLNEHPDERNAVLEELAAWLYCKNDSNFDRIHFFLCSCFAKVRSSFPAILSTISSRGAGDLSSPESLPSVLFVLNAAISNRQLFSKSTIEKTLAEHNTSVGDLLMVAFSSRTLKESFRSVALDILCTSFSNSSVDTAAIVTECRLLRCYLERNATTATLILRQRNSSMVKVFMQRLMKALRSKTWTQELERAAVQFTSWLLGFLLDCLYPGAVDERRSFSLEILLQLVQVMQSNAVPTAIRAAFQPIYSPHGVLLLFDCAIKAYKLVNSTALKILSYFPSNVVCNTPALLNQHWRHAAVCVQSLRERDVEGGISIFLCILAHTGPYRKFFLPQILPREKTSSKLKMTEAENAATVHLSPSWVSCDEIVGEEHCVLQLVAEALDLLDTQANVAETDIAQAAQFAPMYGTVHFLRELFRAASPTFVSFERDELATAWKATLKRSLRSLQRVCRIVLQPLAMAAPEAIGTVDYVPVELRNYDCAAAALPDQVNQILYRAPEEQLVSVCCWHVLKEISFLLGEALFSPLPSDVAATLLLLDTDDFSHIGDVFLEVLSKCRHKGAIEKAHLGFRLFSVKVLGAECKALLDLPSKWIECLFEQLFDIALYTQTRRSAGLPFAFRAVLSAEAFWSKNRRQSKLIADTIERLLSVARGDSSSAKEHSWTARIHCLNILTAIFKDSTLCEDSEPYVGEALRLVFSLFSPLWGVQNSRSMLYTVILKRIVGEESGRLRCGDSSVAHFSFFFVTYNQSDAERLHITFHTFLDRFPGIDVFLLDRLLISVDCYSSRSNAYRFKILLRQEDLFSRTKECVEQLKLDSSDRHYSAGDAGQITLHLNLHTDAVLVESSPTSITVGLTQWQENRTRSNTLEQVRLWMRMRTFDVLYVIVDNFSADEIAADFLRLLVSPLMLVDYSSHFYELFAILSLLSRLQPSEREMPNVAKAFNDTVSNLAAHSSFHVRNAAARALPSLIATCDVSDTILKLLNRIDDRNCNLAHGALLQVQQLLFRHCSEWLTCAEISDERNGDDERQPAAARSSDGSANNGTASSSTVLSESVSEDVVSLRILFSAWSKFLDLIQTRSENTAPTAITGALLICVRYFVLKASPRVFESQLGVKQQRTVSDLLRLSARFCRSILKDFGSDSSSVTFPLLHSTLNVAVDLLLHQSLDDVPMLLNECCSQVRKRTCEVLLELCVSRNEHTHNLVILLVDMLESGEELTHDCLACALDLLSQFVGQLGTSMPSEVKHESIQTVMEKLLHLGGFESHSGFARAAALACSGSWIVVCATSLSTAETFDTQWIALLQECSVADCVPEIRFAAAKSITNAGVDYVIDLSKRCSEAIFVNLMFDVCFLLVVDDNAGIREMMHQFLYAIALKLNLDCSSITEHVEFCFLLGNYLAPKSASILEAWLRILAGDCHESTYPFHKYFEPVRDLFEADADNQWAEPVMCAKIAAKYIAQFDVTQTKLLQRYRALALEELERTKRWFERYENSAKGIAHFRFISWDPHVFFHLFRLILFSSSVGLQQQASELVEQVERIGTEYSALPTLLRLLPASARQLLCHK